LAIPTVNRLTRREDFEEVFKKGKTVSGSFLFLKRLIDGRKTKPRISVVVPLKTAKMASRRNKARRIVSEVINSLLDKIDSKLTAVIVVTKMPENNINKLLRDDCLSVIKKSNILK